jgi:hypothetical protein
MPYLEPPLGCLTQIGCELPLEEFKELVLVWADLNEDDVIVTGLDVVIDRLQMAIRRWPAARR